MALDREEVSGEGSQLDDELGSLAGVLRELAAPPRPLAVLAVGAKIEDAYEIERMLGAGGMGVVYGARDLKLGREVAIKVHSAVDAAARARLLREAEALARLSHPNVVAVHRVGEVSGQVYFAMELVRGGTLRTWLQQAQRTRAQILAVLLAAGEGVAAAHRAGLVHRDFKPENVLIDDDGRAKVADFGLAIAAAAAGGAEGDERPSEVPVGPGLGVGSAPPRLTDVRAVMGTPRYMAPEQQRGERVDASCDQFAFCVTAWEALFGAEPFGELEGDERIRRIAGAAPVAAGAPAYLVRALGRGLSADPARRFASMDALLSAMRADPVPRRKKLVVAALLVATTAAAGVFAYGRNSAPPPACGGESAASSVWTAARRQALFAAFSSGPSWRAEVGQRAADALDGRAAAWRAADRQACRKSQIERTWTAAQHERAGGCLDRRLRELDAAIGVLTGGDVAAVGGRAVAVVELLPPVTSCLDPAQLALDRTPPPATPEAAAAARRAEDQLSVAARSRDGGDLSSAQRAIDAVTDPLALSVPSVAAAKANEQALLAIQRGDAGKVTALTEAFYAARRAGLFTTSAELALRTAAAAISVADREAAERWLRLGEAEVAGLSLGAASQTLLLQTRAIWLESEGKVGDALVELERALRLGRSVAGERESKVDLTPILGSKAAFEGGGGRFTEAVATGRELVTRLEARFGPYHPDLARVLSNLSLDLAELGEHREAITASERAVAITRTMAVGPNVALADRLLNLGVALQAGDRLAEAAERYREARASYAAIHGELHPDVALCDSNLAGLLSGLGQLAEAQAAGERAVAVFRAVAPEHIELPSALMNLAQAEEQRGLLPAARRHIEESVRRLRAQQGSRVALAEALGIQAWIELGAGQLAAAQRSAEESIALWRDGASSPQEIVHAEQALAEVALRRGDRARARALIDAAIARVSPEGSVAAGLQKWKKEKLSDGR